MSAPWKEAHRFVGVFPDPQMVELAKSELAKIAKGGQSHFDQLTLERMQKTPPLDRSRSMHFSDGSFFDIQEDLSGQYIVFDLLPNLTRPRCDIGDWIVQMKDGTFRILKDEDYRLYGGEEDK